MSDHEFVVSGQNGSNPFRLELAEGSAKQPSYRSYEKVPQYDERIEWTQANWINGHGQYKAADPLAYFDGQSIDTTQDGRIILGPLISQVYQTSTLKDSYTTGADGGAATYLNAWIAQTFTASSSYSIGSCVLYLKRVNNPGTFTVGVYATSSSKPTGSALTIGTIDGNTLSTDYAWVDIIFTTSVSLTSGTEYALVCDARSSPDNTQGVYVGYDGSSPSYATGAYCLSTNGGSTWTQYTNYDLQFKTYEITSTELDSTPACFLWVSTAGKFLCADSTEIYYYANGAWNEATTQVTGVTDLKEYNGVIYAAAGASTKYYYSADGDTWTQTDLTDGYANKFLVAPNADGTANVLWKFKTPNEVSSTTDGRTVAAGGAQWTTPAYVGDTTSNIQNLFLLNDELMVGRADNLYNYDNSGGIHALMNELQNARSTQNFKYAINWQSGAYFSVGNGVGELIGQSPGVYTKMGPLENTGDIDKVGVVKGIAADTDYIYVAMLEGTVTHIYKGKPIYTDTGYGWQWCPLVYLGTNACETIYVAQHTTTDRRLWFGYGTHTGYVQISDNPTADANARFAPSGFVRMSYTYGNNGYWDKMIQSIVTETKNCAAGISVTPKYRKDTDTSMSALTSAITSNGVVKTNLTSALSGKAWQFEVDLATNNSTITPELLSFTVRGTEKPESFRVHDATYIIRPQSNLHPSTVVGWLKAGRTSTTLIKFSDLRLLRPSSRATAGTAGTDYVSVFMLPGYPEVTDIRYNAQQEPEVTVHVVMGEVNNT